MALDNPEDEMSPLWKVAIIDGKYRECAYLQGNWQGKCPRFRRFGPLACFACGFQDGLDAGYDYGYEDGRNSLCSDFEREIAEEEERNAGMD